VYTADNIPKRVNVSGVDGGNDLNATADGFGRVGADARLFVHIFLVSLQIV
jgi:hypothetical protein